MNEVWSRIAQHVAGGSRTDVLRSLVWPNAMLLTALTLSSFRQSQPIVIITLIVLLVVFMLLYAVAYIYFAVTDANLLRSERSNLEKMAIERGIYGDSLKGISGKQEALPNGREVPEVSEGGQA